MTLGAISQCKRIEVYSNSKGGKWYFTYIDLDEVKDEDEPFIPKPKGKDVTKEYEKLIGDQGTLVIWKKIDRMENLKEEDTLKITGLDTVCFSILAQNKTLTIDSYPKQI